MEISRWAKTELPSVAVPEKGRHKQADVIINNNVLCTQHQENKELCFTESHVSIDREVHTSELTTCISAIPTQHG